jgi:SAM-dependent methyltransferase
MSHTESRSTNDDFHYIGSELEVFAHAIRWKSYLACQVRPYLKGRVLEVGAGIGGTTKALATGKVSTWTCLEPDAKLAAILQESAKSDPALSRIPIEVKISSVTELAADDSYDAIIYIDVLEHIENDAQELQNAARHLVPGGRLVVLSPAHQSLWSPFDEAIGHYRRYNSKALKEVGPVGCHLIRLRYLDCVGLLASSANRLVLRSSDPSKWQIAMWDGCMVPISRLLDPLLAYRLGKSILGVWCRE